MSMKMLLASNSEAEISLISEMLEDYEIITTGDGLDVLQIVGMNRDVALVILDLNISNMNGFELLSFFKCQKRYHYVRIIVLSDSESAEDEIKCLNLGAHDYIRKQNQMLSLQGRVKVQHDIIRRQREFVNLEQLILSIFEQAPVGISISYSSEPSDINRGSLLNVNREFERICGRKRAELVKLGWAQITHPDDLEENMRLFHKLQAGEIDTYSMEKRYIRPDGSVVWVHMIVATLNIINDNEHNHICLIQDITEQKSKNALYTTEQNAFRTFINSSQDLVFLKDENFKHVFVNDALADYFNLSKKELIGKSDFDLMDDKSANQCRMGDQKAIDENKTISSIEKMGERVFETRKFPVPISENKTWVGAYIRDITTQYNQQEIIAKISETNKIIALCMLKPFTDIQEQLDYVLHEAIKITESKYGYIYLYDEEKKEFTLNSWTRGVMDDCAVIDQQTKYQLEKTGIWGEVVRQRKPIIVNNFATPNPLKKGYPEGHVQIQKYMSIPIFENNRIVAVIGFANSESNYTENDIYAMTVLMNGVWTAIKKREREKETEILLERTQSMFNHHEAVMMLVDPQTGQIIEFNDAAVRFYGYTREELMGMKLQNIAVGKEETVCANLLKALNKEQAFFTVGHRLKNGEIRMVDVFSSPIDYYNKKVLFPIIFDVTERETVSRQNDYLVYHDHLTGLYNRRFFDEDFNRRYHNIRAYPLGVIWGDINGFKMYNDSFGHLQGDYALMEVADKMLQCLEKGDVLARVGGDEFAILTSNTDEEKLRACLNKLEWAVNNGTSSALTISFGYGIQRKQTDTMDMLVKEAEAFMYNRKYYSSKSTRSNAVKVIMETLFAKSEREKYHSERVGLISEAIAKKLNLDQQTIDKVRVAGFLHDIGKIGIDERILNKMELLDKNEWEIMKLHSAKGADILQNTIEFQDIAECVLSHHERFDGTGYPNRLKGDKIPLVSRIIAVADAYDAMTNDRSYRHKISHKSAVEEIKQCAGTFFDLEIVEVFIKMPLVDIKRLESGEKPVS